MIKRKKEGLNLKEGFLNEEGDKVILRPLDLANDVFYFAKRQEYSNKSEEEQNPLIGIVTMK